MHILGISEEQIEDYSLDAQRRAIRKLCRKLSSGTCPAKELLAIFLLKEDAPDLLFKSGVGPVATYDLESTPDGNTLIVVGTRKVYFLE